MSIKQVLVVRRDLKMNKGKIAAQCAHAAMKVFFDDRIEDIIEEDQNDPHGDIFLKIRINKAMQSWLDGSYTKVVTVVDSKEELLNIYKEAWKNKIPASLVVDEGRTQFNGKSTETVVAVGPDYEEYVNLVTGNLKLL